MKGCLDSARDKKQPSHYRIAYIIEFAPCLRRSDQRRHTADDGGSRAVMAGYNRTRQVEELLERHTKSPPSFSVHLYPEHWSLNQGGKFLYNNQIAVRSPAFLGLAM